MIKRIHKYEQIKEDILKEISSGKFKPGDKIYSENELISMYNVSSTTVVKALNDLIVEGYVVRKQGKGSYVRKNLTFQPVKFSERFKKGTLKNDSIEDKITFVWYPDVEDEKIHSIVKELNEKEKSNLICVTQIGFLNNEIWKLQNRYFINADLDENTIKSIEKGESVSKILKLDRSDLSYPMDMKIFCDKFDPSKELNEILKNKAINISNISDNNVFKIKKIIYKDGYNIFEIEDSYYIGKYYRFDITTRE